MTHPITRVSIRVSIRAALITAVAFGAFVAEASSWLHRAPSSASVYKIAPIPGSSTLFAGTSGGLFRSLDDGNSWTLVPDVPRSQIFLLTVNRTDSRYLYAANNFAHLFRSVDGGAHWSRLGPLPGTILALETDPFDGTIVWVSILNQGLYKSTDRGDSWARADAGLGLSSRHLAIRPDDGTVYVGRGDSAIYASKDGGTTWTQLPSPTVGHHQTISMFAIPGALLVDRQGELLQTTNDGVSWTVIKVQAPPFPHIASYAVHPQTGVVYIGTEEHGIFRRIADEDNWALIGPETFETPVRALAFGSDGSRTTLFAGTSGRGVFRSLDDGRTWVAPSVPIDTAFIRSIAFDSTAPGTVYAGTERGLFRSRDRGDNWTLIGLPFSDIVTLIVQQDVIIAATSRDGVFRSTDDADTWQRMGGNSPTSIRAVVADPRDGRRLAAATINGAYISHDGETWTRANAVSPITAIAFDAVDSQTILMSTSHTIWRSTDGGVLFDKFGTPPTGPILSLRNDPSDPNRIYAGTSTTGLWVSTDRGERWTRLEDRLEDVQGYAFASASEMYVTSSASGVYRSVDGGHHWELAAAPLSGIFVLSIAIEPQSRELWLGTGSGLFRPLTLSRRRSIRH